MRIENDTVIFDDADFDKLSDFAKKTLPPYSGTTPFPETFASQINAHILIAKSIAKQTSAKEDPRIDEILSGLAEADPVKLAAAEQCLADLQAILKAK